MGSSQSPHTWQAKRAKILRSFTYKGGGIHALRCQTAERVQFIFCGTDLRRTVGNEVKRLEIIVCDAPMGVGKTRAAITMMNERKNEKFIFVTPYLDETKRIVTECKSRNFITPDDNWGSKLASFEHHISNGRNIATTHSLFSICTEYTAELIHNGDYVLVLDEVFEVAEPISITKSDFNNLLKGGCIEVAEDGEHIIWTDKNYTGKHEDLKRKAKAGTVILYKDILLVWTFPVEIFKAFKEVYILTYMFDCQAQRYYFDMNGIPNRKISAYVEDGVYRFCDDSTINQKIENLRDRVSVFEEEKLNRIGDFDFSLSSSWYKREDLKKGKPLLKILGNNMCNYFRHKCHARVGDVLWTSYKKHIESIDNNGYAGGYVACNIRATNDYRERIYLAYCINLYFHPLMKTYFTERGCTIDEDGYALSEMIQWIWRSSIRDGNPIKVYVPSKRMREMLLNWIDSVS